MQKLPPKRLQAIFLMRYNNCKQNLPYKGKGKRMLTRKVSADRKGANIIIRKAKQKLLKYSDNTIKEKQ